MSVDGFSISSLGLPKDITSAQAAATAEQLALTGNTKSVGKIDNVLYKKINNEEEKEQEGKSKYFEDGYESNEEDEENLDEEKNEEDLLINLKKYKKLLSKDPENVTIRVNKKNDKIELYNKSTKKILESIKAEDFLDMLNKLDYNSGILANFNI